MNHSHRVYIPRIDNLCIPSWWGRKKLHTYKSSRIFAEVKVNIWTEELQSGMYLRYPIVFYKPLSELAGIINAGQNSIIAATFFRSSVKHVHAWNRIAWNAVVHNKHAWYVSYDAESVCLTQGRTKERPTSAGTRAQIYMAR